MRYQIQTEPIIEAVNARCGCPFCVLREKYSAYAVKRFLGDAVMEPLERVKVNKTGFCDEHFSALFKGENKLGLSLQVNTRTRQILKDLKPQKSIKSAVKESDEIDKKNSGCVICDEIDDIMSRYALTAAAMFDQEPDFKKVLSTADGLCLKHYSLLLKNARGAEKSAVEYLESIYNLTVKTLEKSVNDTDKFAKMFDFKSDGKIANAEKIVPDSINAIRGKII